MNMTQLEKISKTILDYALKINANDFLLIEADVNAQPLTEIVVRDAKKKSTQAKLITLTPEMLKET